MTLGEERNFSMQMTRDLKLEELVPSAQPEDAAMAGKSRNKDLQKTKLCIYNSQGVCSLGESCPFAHSVSEIRAAPNLAKTQLCKQFMNGYCRNENCNYAHGEAELVNPPNFKKKMCHWHTKGKCRNGAKCGFAHSRSELAPGAEEEEEDPQMPMKKAPPGLEFDWDASTIAPSSLSDKSGMSGKSNMSRASMPDENLYRMMAGRGSAPLREQVASMGAALADLQAKLSEVEGKMSSDQRSQMQQRLQQLSSQHSNMEANHPPSMQIAAKQSTMNPAAEPFYPSKERTTNEKRSNSVVKKARPKVSAPPIKLSKTNRQPAKDMSWRKLCERALLGVLVIGLMAMVELYLK